MSTPWKLAHAKASEAHHATIRRILYEAGLDRKRMPICGICTQEIGNTLHHVRAGR